ncbi:hypothetical protein AB6A40_005179 [Gnathostoma spinigerum]|uniref:C2 domain-containing protein n=1 Tax=Gnathostoma spinigerum TaxID=75299 RepID=A0ABD6EEP0_9BILA
MMRAPAARERSEDDDGLSDEQDQLKGNLTNIDVVRLMKDITFVRINIDSVNIDGTDEYIQQLIQNRSLYGFVLEYQFPSLDTISTSLKAHIRINAKSFDSSVIHFRHRRVVRISPNPDIFPLWRKSSLVIRLSVQLNTVGKFSTKLIGECKVPLNDLLIPPFIISRDFPFVGRGFSASSFIRIDLGSNIQSLMDHLEFLRNDFHNENVCRASRSRSLSRSRSVSRSSSASRGIRITDPPIDHQGRPPVPPISFEKTNRLSRIDSQRPSYLESNISPDTPLPSVRSVSPSPNSPSSSYHVRLTVHSARRLPLISRRGELIAPSTYVSINGEDGQMFCSAVRANCLNPVWNWTKDLHISRDRQNLVIKLWRKCITGADKVIGFVSIPLPPRTAQETEYELSDLSQSDLAPLLKISISTGSFSSSWLRPRRRSPSEQKEEYVSATPTNIPISPPITLSREEIAEKLRRNLKELEVLVSRLKYDRS